MTKAIDTLKGEIDGLNYYIDAYYEEEPVDVAYDTEDENKEYVNRFENGELLNLCVQVTVYDKSGNLEGTDSLGHCHINSNDCLNDVQDMVTSHDMITVALEDLKTKFNNLSL